MVRVGCSWVFPSARSVKLWYKPIRLSSDIIVSLKASLVKKNRKPWHILQYFLFSSLCPKHKWSFLGKSLWEPSWATGGKTHKSVESLYYGVFISQTWAQRASIHSSVTIQVFLYWHSFLWRLWFSVSTFVSPILWAVVCPMTSLLWQIWKRVVDFGFVHHLSTCCTDRVVNSKHLTFLAGNQKSFTAI